MEDDDLGFGTSQKRGAKTGRRAAPVSATPAPTLDEEELSTVPPPKNEPADGPPGRPNKAVSGWGEAPARKPRERLKQTSPDKNEDSDDDIPVIPELEEQQEDDLTTKVASAPNVTVNRVATYRELDNDLLKQAAFRTLDNDIDLKLLTKAMYPLEDIIEDDKPWDWDRLFTEVSSELRAELEKVESDGDEDKAVELEQ